MKQTTSATLIDEVLQWLNQQALNDTGLEAIVRGTCERLAAAGLPLARAYMSFSMLHPLYRAVGYLWERGKGFSVEKHRHIRGGEADRFLKSPFYHLVKNDLPHLRRRIHPSGGPAEFPIFDELRHHRLPGLYPQIPAFLRARHDRIVGVRSRGRIFR
jgi:adenylate cyclase